MLLSLRPGVCLVVHINFQCIRKPFVMYSLRIHVGQTHIFIRRRSEHDTVHTSRHTRSQYFNESSHIHKQYYLPLMP